MLYSKMPVVLQFSDLKDLWAFSQELSPKEIHINTWNKILRFRGTEAEVSLAVTTYKAKILKTDELQENALTGGGSMVS